MNTIKEIAAALTAALLFANAAHAADRLPGELLGCWEWSHSAGGNRQPDAVYKRVDDKECKGAMLISTDGYGGNFGSGDIDCRLRSVLSAKPGRYQFLFQCAGGPIFTSTMTLRGAELTVRETP